MGDPNVKTLEDYLPDCDLGKSVKFRNKIDSKRPFMRDGSYDKVFGLPTIRNDLKKKSFNSITDYCNYGNQPDAYELLYPYENCSEGLLPQDFEMMISKTEVRIM